MKLTPAQKQFIRDVEIIERDSGATLWLQMEGNRWMMESHGVFNIGFYVNGRLVKSLSEKNILVNKPFKNNYGIELEGMALNDEFRELELVSQ